MSTSGSFFSFTATRPVAITMVVAAAVVFGFVGLARLPVNLLPDITYPTITVRTEYEGVAPQEIERLISEPVEALVSQRGEPQVVDWGLVLGDEDRHVAVGDLGVEGQVGELQLSRDRVECHPHGLLVGVVLRQQLARLQRVRERGDGDRADDRQDAQGNHDLDQGHRLAHHCTAGTTWPVGLTMWVTSSM